MRFLLKCLLLAFFCSSSACVTTREQLNDEKGIGNPAPVSSGGPTRGDVKSEDISERPAPSGTAPKEIESDGGILAPNARAREQLEKETPPHVQGIESTGGNATPNASASGAAPLTAPMQGAGNPPLVGPGGGSEPSSAGASTAVPIVVPKATPRPDLSSYSTEELRSEVAQLSGKLEENVHNQELTEQSHLEENKKAQARIEELEKKLKELQPDAPVVPEGKTPFSAGKDAYLANQCEEAITFLSQSLASSDKGKEAEEATYLRGECYFRKAQYNKAIVDFSHFPEKYQKSSFHPKALLRIAESFEAMGRKEDAKAFYSDLLDKFPKTAEGKLAKKRLKVSK